MSTRLRSLIKFRNSKIYIYFVFLFGFRFVSYSLHGVLGLYIYINLKKAYKSKYVWLVRDHLKSKHFVWVIESIQYSLKNIYI